MERITTAQLEALVKQINERQGTPLTAWTKYPGGIRANIGNYHLDWAYSGVQLVQMLNEGGGIRTLTHGFSTKRECFYLLRAYLDGLRDRAELNAS